MTGSLTLALGVYANVRDPLPPQVWVCGGLAVVGTIIALLALRRVEFAQFCSRHYPNVILLSIARSGPDKAAFDDFVAAVRAQIRACQRESG